MALNESGVSENNKEEEKYLSALDGMLSALARRPGATFLDILRGARGAYPTLVAERLGVLGLDELLPRESKASYDEEPPADGPELHPLDFEWYFTSDCAEQIARLLAEQAEEVLCLAAPTVAEAVARRGRGALLLDNNPLIKLRLPSDLPSLRFKVCNLYDPLPVSGPFPVAFFDAPWYTEPLLYWLWQASRAVSRGGTVAFSLFPTLLRPSAEAERSRILAQAGALGEVRIDEEALAYETPLFEQEALARCGIHVPESWRRGDLVLVRVYEKPQTSPPVAAPSADEWETFLVGPQVVKLRERERGGGDDFIIAPLEGLEDYVFPTVSLRDRRRAQIDLWTSRNRVARVGRRGPVAHALGRFAEGLSDEDVAKSPELSSLNAAERESLLTNLRAVLEMPLEDRDGLTHSRPAVRRLQQRRNHQ
jgi:hypothetical protein